MVSGYPTSTSIPRIDELSMDTPVLINMNILVLTFYGYIKNIGKISMDIFMEILKKYTLFKIINKDLTSLNFDKKK